MTEEYKDERVFCPLFSTSSSCPPLPHSPLPLWVPAITLFKEKRVPRSFLYAVCQHDVDLVLQMLKNGTDIGSTDEMGRNALHTIGWDGAYFMFELLLNHPSMTEKIINHSSQYEGSPLKCIVDYYPDGLEKTEIVCLFRSKGAHLADPLVNLD